MKNKIVSLLMLVPLLFGACEQKLNILPNFSIVEPLALSTTSGMDGGLSYAYQCLHKHLGRDFTLMTEAMGDHLLIKEANNPPVDYVSFYKRDMNAIIERQGSATDARKPNAIILRELYNGVNTAALILRGVKNDLAKDDPTFASNKNRIMGECHFLRAVIHFEMLRFWARAWGATPDNSHPGLVINYEPNVDRESQIKPRATVREVYDFIIADLIKAEDLLPEGYDISLHSPEYYGRAYKDAARGYLARVYFQQHNYEKAKEVIDRLIGATPGSLARHQLEENVAQPFMTRGPEDTSPENIYQTTGSTVVNTLATYWNTSNPEGIFTLNSTNPKGVATAAFVRDADFYTNDSRDTTLFRLLPDGITKTPIKYSLQSHFNIPIIRSAEMVLARAEIYALANNLPAAVQDCNVIRSRARIPLLTTNISQGALLDSIYRERVRELAFEGDRLHDLKRQKKPIPAGDRADTFPLPWDGLELVMKYSPEEIAMNPLLVNNYE